MKHFFTLPVLLMLTALAAAQDSAPQDTPTPERPYEFRYSFATIDDATLYSNLRAPIPGFLNQLLIEPKATMRYHERVTVSASLIGVADSYNGTSCRLLVRESYAGLSAGDFDFLAGRKMVRWGTGYAFTAAGVLDPPRDPTNPTDRLNLNQGRDMVKADWVKGRHALTAAWSTAFLAPANTNLRDTSAFRYNVLVHGFDTSLIAGHDRGGDTFGATTFTRVFGQAWEVHGEAAWREQGAVLMGAKYTTASGVTFIGEYFTPPNIPYYRDMTVSPLAGRQNYAFFNAAKSRLRELPGWKEWDLGAYVVTNLNDHSYVAAFDANRRFGNRFSAYLHLEIPHGAITSDYGATPYSTATSLGVRFQL
jgi:hypothetical protein